MKHDKPQAHGDIRADLRGTPYDPVRPLAVGGMGEVHVVRHRALGEERVLKLVRVLGEDTADELARRMTVEGRILRALRHPHIVAFLDLGVTASGKPYLVTEYLKGCTLAEELGYRSGTVPGAPARFRPAEAFEVLDAILAATGCAHEAGVVHRDLKPQNCFYAGRAGERENRTVKVLDFGIAKVLSPEAKLRAGSALVATKEGLSMGSASYMPPEQVLGQRVDHRADIYAIGCVGFFLLTGKPPYKGTTALEIMEQQIVAAPRSPREVDPTLPAAFSALIERAMAKEPDARFQTADAMRAALAEAMGTKGPRGPAHPQGYALVASSPAGLPPVVPTAAAFSAASTSAASIAGAPQGSGPRTMLLDPGAPVPSPLSPSALSPSSPAPSAPAPPAHSPSAHSPAPPRLSPPHLSAPPPLRDPTPSSPLHASGADADTLFANAARSAAQASRETPPSPPATRRAGSQNAGSKRDAARDRASDSHLEGAPGPSPGFVRAMVAAIVLLALLVAALTAFYLRGVGS